MVGEIPQGMTDDDVLAEVHKLRDAGFSIRAIALEVGRAKSWVGRKVKAEHQTQEVATLRQNPAPTPSIPSGPRPFLAYDARWNDKGLEWIGHEHLQTYVNPEKIDVLLAWLTNEPPEKCIRIWYGLEQPVNQMFRSLKRWQLLDLFDGRYVSVGDYDVRYFSHHELLIEKGGKRWTFYDVSGFFGEELREAYHKYLGTDYDKMAENADARLYATHRLMDTIRPIVEWDATPPLPKVKLRSWCGPGSVAGTILNGAKVGARKQWNDYPYEVQRASELAFFGGRVELLTIGRSAPIYTYDLHSAYPWAMTQLWQGGRWKRQPFYSAKYPLGLWQVEWDLSAYRGQDIERFPGPFPWRSREGEVCYPGIGRGWYWTPEVAEAVKQWEDAITVGSGFVLTDYELSPLGPIIQALYRRRRELQAAKDPRAAILKAVLVALFGKLCQQRGYRSHTNLAMAGYATSLVRARVYQAMMRSPNSVIDVLTDSVHFQESEWMHPDIPTGSGLGEWGDGEYSTEGCYLLPTIYDLDRGRKVRSGGIPERELDWNDALRQIAEKGTADVWVSLFVNHQLALTQKRFRPYRLQTLRPTDHTPANKLTLDPIGASRRSVSRAGRTDLDTVSIRTSLAFSLPGEGFQEVVESYPPGGYQSDGRELGIADALG